MRLALPLPYALSPSPLAFSFPGPVGLVSPRGAPKPEVSDRHAISCDLQMLSGVIDFGHDAILESGPGFEIEAL